MSIPLWITIQLGEIVLDTQPGFAQRPNQENIGVPQLRTNNISREGNLDLSEISYVDADDSMLQKYGVLRGDVIFNNTNSPELVGKTAFFDLDTTWVISNHMTRIRVDPDLADAEYLSRYLHYLWQIGAIKSWAKQWVNQAAIDQQSLKKIEIALPLPLEQRRIAAILRQADMLRQWRREASKKIEKLQKSLFINMFGDPYENPKGWDPVSVESLKRSNKPVIRTGPFGSSLKKHEYTPEGVPVWGIDNVKPNEFVEDGSLFISEAKFRELGNYIVEDGDILISRAGTTGRMCVAHPKQSPSIIGTNLLRLSFDQEKIVPEFFTTMFTFFWDRVARTLRASGETDAYSFINPKDLKALIIPLPDIKLQNDFLDRLTVINAISTDQATTQNKLGLLMQSLLARAFIGELTTSWREVHKEELQRAAVERDKKLGLRGEVPTLRDFEEGRITPEELEPIRQALGQFAVNLIEISETVTPLFEMSQKIFEPLIQALRASQQATSPIQLSKIPGIDSESVLHYIDNLPVRQRNRTVIESLDTTTLRVLKIAGTYPAYFTADDLEAGELGGITTLQAETSLRTLQALGFVKLVQIDGLLRYRLTVDDDYGDMPYTLQP